MTVSVRRRGWLFSALRRSALVRRCDRLEAVATLIALAVVVIAIPVAVLAGRAAYSADAEHSAAEARDRHSVEASVVGVEVIPRNRLPYNPRRVHVRWTSAFQERVGSFTTVEPVRIGDSVTVWLDKDGEMTDPPGTLAQAQGSAIGTGLAVWTGTALVGLVGLTGLRLTLNRRRYASWDDQWRLISTRGGWANRDR